MTEQRPCEETFRLGDPPTNALRQYESGLYVRCRYALDHVGLHEAFPQQLGHTGQNLGPGVPARTVISWMIER